MVKVQSQYKDMAIITCLKSFYCLFHIVFWVGSSLFLMVFARVLMEPNKSLTDLSVSGFFTGPRACSNVVNIIICSVGLFNLISRTPSERFENRMRAIISVIGLILVALLVYDRDSCIEKIRDNLTNCSNAQNISNTSFDLVQSKVGCCGVCCDDDGTELSPQGSSPPCCVDFTSHATSTNNSSDLYENAVHDCFESIFEGSKLVIGFALGMALLPPIGIVLSWNLSYYHKKQNFNNNLII